jgi:outer membrane protein assembly factor BamB
MMKYCLRGAAFAAACVILVLPGVAQADSSDGRIDVSFASGDLVQTGPAVLGEEGDRWNAADGNRGQRIALTNVKGEKTQVRISFDADRTYDAANNSPFAGGVWENLMRKYLVATDAHKVTLEGLTPGAPYTLVLYSGSDRSGDRRETRFSVGGQSKSATFSFEKTKFVEGVNYVRLTAAADREGRIEIAYEGESSEGNLNGLQLAPAGKGDLVRGTPTPSKPADVKPAPSARPATSAKPKPEVASGSSAKKNATTSPSAGAAQGQWPGWLGPNHDGKSADRGLLTEWPEGGPTLLWKATGIGKGYSGVAVAGGTVYITGDTDEALLLFAYDLEGKLKWQVPHGPPCKRDWPGSRATPTIDGKNLYLLSGNGLVGCFDAQTGERRWTKDAAEFGGQPGGWGYSESVLIEGNLAVFKPGGKSCIVALDKLDGQTVWTSKGFSAGPEYGSCLALTHENVRMIVTGTREGLVSVDARDGHLLWQNKFAAGNIANCPTPAYQDGYVFWANGYGKGGVCMKLGPNGTADEAWTTRDMDCHHGGYILDQGCIFGSNGGKWTCLDLRTGEKKWSERGVGKGSLCWADGMLYLFSERAGEAALATCSPDGLEIKGRLKVDGDGPSWAHPVVAGGRLYLRYDTTLYCFDVRAR